MVLDSAFDSETSTAPPTSGQASRATPGLAWQVGWWSLLAAVFATPLALGNFSALPGIESSTFSGPLIVKVFVLAVLTAISLAAWSVDVAFHGGRIRYTAVGWLVLGLVVWVGVSTAFSIHPPTALLGQPGRHEGLLAFVNYAVIYHLVLQYADRSSRVRTLASVLVASSVPVALYGIIQSAGLDPAEWGKLGFETQRAFSTYGNPDILGGFLMFSVPVALGLALSQRSTGLRIAYWAASGLNALCLVVTFTRGAWIGAVVGVALVSFAAWRSPVRLTRLDWMVIGATVASIAAVVLRSLTSASDVLNIATRLRSIFEFRSGSGLTRTQIMQTALDAISARPVTGFRADTFRFVFPALKPIEYVRDAGALSIADNAHSYPLHIAAGVGIVGAVALFGAMAWGAVVSAPIAFARTSDVKRLIYGGFWAAGAAYLTQMLFGLSTPGSTFLLWVVLGVVLSPTARESLVPLGRRAQAAAVLVAVICVAVVAMQVVFLTADRHYQLSNTTDIDARVAHAVRAAQLNPLNFLYRGEVGLARAQDYLAAAETARAAEQQGVDATSYREVERQKFQAAEAALREAILFSPQVPEVYVFLAAIYNEAAQRIDRELYQRTIATAQEGIAADPFGLAIRVELARALAATDQTDRAISTLEYALRLDPTFREAISLLAELQAGPAPAP